MGTGEAFMMIEALRLKIRKVLVMVATKTILASVNSPSSKRGKRVLGTLTFRGVHHLKEVDPSRKREM